MQRWAKEIVAQCAVMGAVIVAGAFLPLQAQQGTFVNYETLWYAMPVDTSDPVIVITFLGTPETCAAGFSLPADPDVTQLNPQRLLFPVMHGTVRTICVFDIRPMTEDFPNGSYYATIQPRDVQSGALLGPLSEDTFLFTILDAPIEVGKGSFDQGAGAPATPAAETQ